MSTPTPPAPWRGRWVVLAGIVLVALNLRIAVAAVSPILDAVRADVDLTETLAGVLGAVPLASFALFGSVAPIVARRAGLEPTLVAAMAMSGVGEVARSLVSTPTPFLGWSVIALAGMGMGNVLLPPLVKRYFPDRIGPVTAVYSMAMAVSTSVPAVLAAPIARQAGWRVSIATWAVIGFLAVVPWCVVIARSSAARASLRGILARSPARGAGPASRHRSGGRVWRTSLAWAMAVTFGLNSLNTYVIFAWLPQMLADAGLDPSVGGRWLGLFAILGLPLSFAGPMLAARMRNPYPVVLVLAGLFVAGYAGLLLAPAHGTAAWMLMLGLAPGTFPMLLALINLRTRTSAGATSLSGFVQGIGYTLSVPGPVLAGVLHERTGSWTPVFGILIGTVLLMAVVAAAACRPSMLEDRWGAVPDVDPRPGR
ncbi:CynX/NimT family MFS transporter [uncultured Cellulomonas sp.]|uniref:MFS transporter n=1 Tax=uncultured Cellulomonas sp. TaxID=189682 RepID=UPI00261683BD|nr:MFS transporter [uncultured Cellulomonas sp.]